MKVIGDCDDNFANECGWNNNKNNNNVTDRVYFSPDINFIFTTNL